jgi:hypothetical protein
VPSPGRSLRIAAAMLAAACGLLAAACSGPGKAVTATAHPATAHPAAAHPAGASRPAGGPTAPPSPAAENARRGTWDWHITKLGAPGAIEGYTDHVSVLPGRSFRLFVSTTAPSYRVLAFRMGWYRGSQARLVWKSGRLPGRVQAAPRIAPVTHLVTAPWRPSLTVSTRGWPQGAYLLRLDARNGAQRYVPVTVRSPSTRGKVVLLLGATTWQAYSLWGGYSLYDGPQGAADRGYEVSYDRPYDQDGAERFLVYDLPAISLAESFSRLPVAYETDVDVSADPGLLAGARAVISLGHDEYYSAAMRRALLRARDAGTNLAFLGANAMYRHIRFGSSPLGPDRVIICYKDATIDPMYRKDKSATTQNWRDPPDPRPESVVTGVFYECNPVSVPYVVSDPENWIFAGTGVKKGTSFPGLVGPEYDRVNPALPFPRPLEVLAHSPLTCDGVRSYADSAYYTVPSGAGVFASGTMRWVCAMRGPALCGHGVSAAARRFVDRATRNLLRAFAAGPAGRSHPARSNLAAVRPARGSRFEGT